MLQMISGSFKDFTSMQAQKKDFDSLQKENPTCGIKIFSRRISSSTETVEAVRFSSEAVPAR